MNEHRELRSSDAIFLGATEEEYAAAFRTSGWGEHAIEIELERFRAFKAGTDIHRVMTTREAVKQVLHEPAATKPPPAIPEDQDELLAALARARKRRAPPQ